MLGCLNAGALKSACATECGVAKRTVQAIAAARAPATSDFEPSQDVGRSYMSFSLVQNRCFIASHAVCDGVDHCCRLQRPTARGSHAANSCRRSAADASGTRSHEPDGCGRCRAGFRSCEVGAEVHPHRCAARVRGLTLRAPGTFPASVEAEAGAAPGNPPTMASTTMKFICTQHLVGRPYRELPPSQQQGAFRPPVGNLSAWHSLSTAIRASPSFAFRVQSP